VSFGRILAQQLGKSRQIFVTPQPQILLNTTHMGQMTPPKPLIITICTWQEMMVWMSMELIGLLGVIW
jgi:hypothetical protein